MDVEGDLDVAIAQEIEVTTQRKRKATTVATKRSWNKKTKPTKAKSAREQRGSTGKLSGSQASRKRKPKATKLLTKVQRSQVATINREEVLAYVVSRVPGELISDLFPDRLNLWEFLTGSDTERLKSLVDFATNKHIALYNECSTERSKCSELFLQWLAVVRKY